MNHTSLMLAGLLVAIISLPVASAIAQTVTSPNPDPVPITLEEAVNAALKQSPVLGASASRADAATASLSGRSFAQPGAVYRS